jgi:hypothetical protein
MSKPDFKHVPSGAFNFGAGAAPMITNAAGENKPFSMVVSAGQVMDHWYFGSVCVDLASLKMSKSTIPALVEHDGSAVAGVIEGMEKTADACIVKGTLYASEPEGATVIRRLSEKPAFPYQASGRFRPKRVMACEKGMKAVINGREEEGPLQLWYDTDLEEGSFCPFGLDRKTSAALASEDGATVDISSVLENQKGPDMATEADVKAAEEKGRTDGAKVAAETLKAAEDKARAEGIEAGRKAERESIKALMAAATDRSDIVLKAAVDGKSVSDVQALVIEAQRKDIEALKKDAAKKTAPAFVASDGGDGTEKPGEKKDEAASGEFSETQATALMAAHPELARDFGTDAKHVAQYAKRVQSGQVKDEAFAALLK